MNEELEAQLRDMVLITCRAGTPPGIRLQSHAPPMGPPISLQGAVTHKGQEIRPGAEHRPGELRGGIPREQCPSAGIMFACNCWYYVCVLLSFARNSSKMVVTVYLFWPRLSLECTSCPGNASVVNIGVWLP